MPQPTARRLRKIRKNVAIADWNIPQTTEAALLPRNTSCLSDPRGSPTDNQPSSQAQPTLGIIKRLLSTEKISLISHNIHKTKRAPLLPYVLIVREQSLMFLDEHL